MTSTPRLEADRAARLIRERVARGERVISAVVVESGGQAPSGSRLVVFQDGEVEGTLGAAALDSEFVGRRHEVFPAERTKGSTLVAMDEPAVSVYVELHAPSPMLVIVGAGHIAVPLSNLCARIGFRVHVLDDREEYAVAERFPDAESVVEIDFRDPFASTRLEPSTHVILVTRGHRYDYECLVRLLRMDVPPTYVGMIGSRRRVRATHEQLIRDGIPMDRLRHVRAPVGLDLGGGTPEEIAVSVAAEIVMVNRGGTGTPLSEKERIVDRFIDAPQSRELEAE